MFLALILIHAPEAKRARLPQKHVGLAFFFLLPSWTTNTHPFFCAHLRSILARLTHVFWCGYKFTRTSSCWSMLSWHQTPCDSPSIVLSCTNNQNFPPSEQSSFASISISSGLLLADTKRFRYSFSFKCPEDVSLAGFSPSRDFSSPSCHPLRAGWRRRRLVIW